MIGVLGSDCGNARSVVNAYASLGVTTAMIEDPRQLNNHTHLVISGVGSFDGALEHYRNTGIANSLESWLDLNTNKLLGICVGMQIICEKSEEGTQAGLGLIPARVKKLPLNADFSDFKLPHMGWNSIKRLKNSNLIGPKKLEQEEYYFLHSFYLDCDDQDIIVAETDFGVKFPSVINKDNIYGTQFHPEKSHKLGLSILRNFSEL